MNRREAAFLVLTVIGFVVPNTMVAAYVIDHGGTGGYLDAWFDSLPAAQLFVDLGIAFVAFALWAYWEGRRLEMRSWWLPIPASFLVGLCFAVPLFFYLRERKLSDLSSQ